VVLGSAAPWRSLQFDKADSAAPLSQQEKNNSLDVQRGGYIPRGDVPGRRRRMFEPQLRRLRPQSLNIFLVNHRSFITMIMTSEFTIGPIRTVCKE
jgi:hypothetical protein